MDGWENTAELVLIALVLIVQTIGGCVLIFNLPISVGDEPVSKHMLLP